MAARRTLSRSAALQPDLSSRHQRRILHLWANMDDVSGLVATSIASADPAPMQTRPAKAGSIARPVPHTKRRVLLVGVLLAAAIALLVGWLALQPAEVATQTLAARPVEIALSVVGRVQPQNTLDVRSQNAGKVVRLLHDEGDVVARGSNLAVISSDVEAAEANGARSREQAARAEVVRTEQILMRTETLAAKGFASRAALDNARAAKKSAGAMLAAATSEHRAASARLSEFTVNAPMAGIVLLRPVDAGQVITPATMLFQLGSVDAREINAEVDEAYADDLRPGMKVRAAASGSNVIFAAHITEISPRVDLSTGGRSIKLVPNADMPLPPGRTVDVTIVIAVRDNALLVPRGAIIDAGKDPRIYVVNANGRVDERQVKLDPWPSLDAIIADGAGPGDVIVLTPALTHVSARVRARETSSLTSDPED